ncbi:MAG: (E)-4-hydroxy-3-methylbut-2-enyl-diphosphate synthase [Chloroflexi bacterium]|nr:(E)-4-hydroxy-3-methylbut-2-enyl-diphosphate synthase [Chloroflexota bacterium]
MTGTVSTPFERLARTGYLPPRYVPDSYRYHRRRTRAVYVGDVGIGGTNPIRVQSMTTTDTMDTDGTVAETVRLVEAGCEIVRITAPTVEDARNIGVIRRALASKGIRVPLVADIHFSPAAAMEAADHVEKVRINPGNFADSKRFAVREYTDAEYEAELARIEERFAPLVEKCKARGIAMRIGTNHGSLSDRIMNRFGDTPLGMVESALEFARICATYDYHDVVFSMKASNPKVMIQAYRLLAARLDALGLDYPFHLGVTEAGNGEDGRIKSAIGIGGLLEDGIGDTIRVSLTEDPEREVPVAFALARPYQGAGEDSLFLWERVGVRARLRPLPHSPSRRYGEGTHAELPDLRNPYEYTRRAAETVAIGGVAAGGGQPVRVFLPFPGGLANVHHAVERALALAAADGIVERRPDVLSVLVASEADAAALHAMRAALDRLAAQTPETSLPIAACVPPDFPQLTQVVQDADLVSLSTGERIAAETLRAALETVTKRRRPVMLEAVPRAGEVDTAVAAAEAVERVLQAGVLAREAGSRNVIFSVCAREVGVAVRTYRRLESRLTEQGDASPIHLLAWPAGDAGEVLLRSAALLGALLCDGIGDSVQILGATRGLDDQRRAHLAYNILQGAGVRLSKTEFVACPSCGRTLFNLQATTERIQRKTGHLRGVKIAIMGCIVNGPGEMADADFGYVGGAPGKVNLYAGKECVEKGVPAAIADERLIELIRSRGQWVDPPDQPDQPVQPSDAVEWPRLVASGQA